MIVYPALDLQGGRCVRLAEGGEFGPAPLVDIDPGEAARRWVDAGATWLHVVDLDGARAGRPINRHAVEAIRAAAPPTVKVQLSGGLRDAASIGTAFALGADRVVLGTAAIRTPELVSASVAEWGGERVAVGLDARDGLLAAGGWLEQTDVLATVLAERLQAAGVRYLTFTDIRRDGTLKGPNLDALRTLIGGLAAAADASGPAAVIASGGVGTLADVPAVAATGAAGVIIGRALLTGRVDLAAAIAAATDAATVRA
ncbi:MAG: Phosphoribosylformimino-5-aminoimidazole carboxamide ribotide isomerase [uncultured Thermomicrobiales bacterium]|uniref:1-(5-phosphoribosyl)-5-[(5-phosphoribosylamino)methylideneamino] imidazole-4-carboxamide isomerase n=1 Tax=uncultured Thermomicrobiales bacterium TaxID=1645740 RepID=A0A6J4UA34_9BACT|nr:MAG: Phosphoribosylformimino-5-aminoimidazole carboxamide ribotide isomerase [uncultured Thermomicrobiales bacterium]